MKPTLLFATLSMVLATPTVFAKSELDTLRAKCQEQDRQIQHLEDENAKLRNSPVEKPVPASRTEMISTAPAKPAAAAAASTSSSSTYTVKSGDSFEKIARKVGTSPAKLAKSNGLKVSSIIRPGQTLNVPGTASAADKSSPSVSAPQMAKTNGGTHKVRAGDTYSSISKKHGVSTSSLIAANPKVKPSALRPGQLVNLGGPVQSSTMTISTPIARSKAPVEKAAAPVAKAPAAHQTIPVSTAAPAPRSSTPAGPPAPVPAPAPPSHTAAASEPSPTPERKIRPVTIEGEMTYGEFATKHGTDAGRLNALNGLDLTTATVLAKGSELYVPAQP